MTSIPLTHRALVVNAEQDGWEVKEQALPKYDDLQVLVRVHAVGLNPTDWKHVSVNKPGSSGGSDFAGVVAKDAGEFKAGDRVVGFTRGGFLQQDNGAFADYAAAQQRIVWRIPENISFEQAAAVGQVPASTAAHALYTYLNIPRPWSSSKEPSASAGDSILIWSGAAAVSFYAIQLAKHAGLKVYTTASSHNHEALKALGVEAVFDYKDPEVSKKLKDASNGKIKICLDGISEYGSTKLAAAALSDEGGTIATLLPVKDELPPGIKLVSPLLYRILDVNNAEERADIAEWHKVLPKLLSNGHLKIQNIDHKKGGLDAIPVGLEELKQGKVSGKKIVYTIV